MDVPAYLRRLGYRGPLSPDAETLEKLQVSHLLAVPFENLSIHAGEPIALDDAALFDKVVTRRRGGFCYELNGLFAALLRQLGFRVSMLSAGVARSGGGYGPEFDHLALLVELEQRWLADVGFGESFREPLRVDERGEQAQEHGVFRIDPDGPEHLVVMRRDEEGAWTPQYRFGLQPQSLADYAAMCHHHQTSPESHFTQKRVCSLATADGRVTLTGTRLITTRGRAREERDLTAAESAQVLRERFGITLDGTPR